MRGERPITTLPPIKYRNVPVETQAAYREVLGNAPELHAAVAVVRETAPYLLAPGLLKKIMYAEGNGALHDRVEQEDRLMFVEAVMWQQQQQQQGDDGVTL